VVEPVLSATALAAALVAYNNVINRWPPFHRLYVPINLCVAAGVIGLAVGPLDLKAEAALGVTGSDLSLAAEGAALGVLLTMPLYLALASPRWAEIVADRRLEGSSLRQLLYRILIRVPLGTVLLEEVAFRGVLFGLLLDYGLAVAAVSSSVAFGLWHIVPTHATVKVNRMVNGTGTWTAVTGGVLVGMGAGLIFIWLRLRTGTLAAPFGLHAAVNSSATVAAFLALRRSPPADTAS
jgi:membrane protease YdiL (CAAX protease family)